MKKNNKDALSIVINLTFKMYICIDNCEFFFLFIVEI